MILNVFREIYITNLLSELVDVRIGEHDNSQLYGSDRGVGSHDTVKAFNVTRRQKLARANARGLREREREREREEREKRERDETEPNTEISFPHSTNLLPDA